MAYKSIKQLTLMIIIMLLAFSQLGIGNALAKTINQRVAGDDPGVTISGPSSIESRDQVELKVTLATSSGKLDEDGRIQVTIPKSVVNNANDLTDNLVLDDPFYLGSPSVVEDGNGNYILNVAYDHTKLDENDGHGDYFIVKFQAPVINQGNDSIGDSVYFQSDLIKGDEKISTDNTTSEINTNNPGQPLLRKASTRPTKIVDGVKSALMSLNNPSSNVFAIVVNYNGMNLKNAKLVDTTPKGTELTDPDKYIAASGDGTPYQHIRIAKVTSRDAETGQPDAWKYVTNEFDDKITTSSTGFEIDFGDLTSNDSYVVMYAEKVIENTTPEDFGVRYNHADLYSGNDIVKDADTAIALDSSDTNSVSINKSVSQSTLSTTNGLLEYTLTLKSNNGSIAAGTIISDPLPEFTKYIETTKINSSYFSDAHYDSNTNTVSYTLLKDIQEGETQQIIIKSQYSNPDALSGEKIINKASMSYAGSAVYSNDATTTLDGSAYLYKVDALTNDPLAGAEFKIVDNTGKVIVEKLVSDGNGFINSGILSPGEYQFIETKAPDGYKLDSTPLDFSIVQGQETPINLTKTNEKESSTLGSVVLKKVDSDTHKSLAGAEFKLISKDGTLIKEKLETNKNGEITIEGLASGEYQFIETKAPDGYKLDSTPVVFTINENDESKVNLTKENTLIPTEPSSPEPIIPKPSLPDSSAAESSSPEPIIPKPSLPASNSAGKRHPVMEKIIGKLPQTGEKRSALLFAGAGIAILGVGVYLMKKSK